MLLVWRWWWWLLQDEQFSIYQKLVYIDHKTIEERCASLFSKLKHFIHNFICSSCYERNKQKLEWVRVTDWLLTDSLEKFLPMTSNRTAGASYVSLILHLAAPPSVPNRGSRHLAFESTYPSPGCWLHQNHCICRHSAGVQPLISTRLRHGEGERGSEW